jgi:hypothetical protein
MLRRPEQVGPEQGVWSCGDASRLDSPVSEKIVLCAAREVTYLLQSAEAVESQPSRSVKSAPDRMIRKRVKDEGTIEEARGERICSRRECNSTLI